MNTAARIIQDLELGERFDNLVLSCRRERRFGRDLLAFKYRIVSQDAAFGMVLPGYCNLDFKRSRGRTLPVRSKLAVWLRRIHTFAPEVSYKRVHLTTFGKFQFVVRVATSKGTAKDPLPTAEHYSQVTDLLEVVGWITSRGSGV